MNKKELRETDRFSVIDEAGNRYRVIEHTEYEHVQSFGAPTKELELQKQYTSPDAEIVNKNDDDTFTLSVFDKIDIVEVVAKRE